MNDKSSRILNLIGMPGVGKSSLVLGTLEWIEERNMLRGGMIYKNARDISCSIVFARKLCNHLMSNYPNLFQSLRD